MMWSKQNKEEKKLAHIYEQFRNYSMIPEQTFIGNLKLIDAFKSIKGDFVECGVWKGGMSAASATLLNDDRKFFLFDSFEGLPKAKPIDGKAANDWQQDTNSPQYFDNCKVDRDSAETAMKKSGSKNYQIIQGWFDQTLPAAEWKNPIAILRLDGDWYDSTMCCLKNLFPQVAEGGLIIIDDYYFWDGCSRAVHDYLAAVQSPSRIFQSPEGICYLIKRNQ